MNEILIYIVLKKKNRFLTVFHILTQFSSAVTYSMFVTLGLITSVPVSAGTSLLIHYHKKNVFEKKNTQLIFYSTRYCFVWRKFCWYEISWSDFDSNRILSSYVCVKCALNLKILLK